MKCLWYETQAIRHVFNNHIQEAINAIICEDMSEGMYSFFSSDKMSDTVLRFITNGIKIV